MWTDAQRKKFLTFILKKCTKSQLKFVNEGWFKKQLPIHHLDYTTVLPRFICTYIFSFLDPRSLCRAAQVSWHWKFISEQDVIWMPKCLRFGWYLPYTPNNREYGCWKHHYIMCTGSLDMEAPSRMVGYSLRQDTFLKYRISSNNSRGQLFLFVHQMGAIIQGKAIIRGRRLFQKLLLTGSCALNILFYYPIKP